MEIKKELTQLVDELKDSQPATSNSVESEKPLNQNVEKPMENSDNKKERKKLTLEQSQKLLNSCFSLIELKKKALGTMDKLVYTVFKEAVENNLKAKESSYDPVRFAKIQNGVKIFFNEYWKSNFSESFLLQVIRNKSVYNNPLFKDKIFDSEMRSFCAQQSALFFPHLEKIAKKDEVFSEVQLSINDSEKRDRAQIDNVKQTASPDVNEKSTDNTEAPIVERKPSNRM